MPATSVTFSIEGMTCGHCARAVKGIIEEAEGVNDAHVSLDRANATVFFDPASTDAQRIITHLHTESTYRATLP